MVFQILGKKILKFWILNFFWVILLCPLNSIYCQRFMFLILVHTLWKRETWTRIFRNKKGKLSKCLLNYQTLQRLKRFGKLSKKNCQNNLLSCNYFEAGKQALQTFTILECMFCCWQIYFSSSCFIIIKNLSLDWLFSPLTKSEIAMLILG